MWSVEFLNETVLAEMQGQPNDIKAKFAHIVQLVEAVGLERVHEPYIKHLEGKVWEMRMKGKDTIARALYVTAVEKRIVVVRVFVKKTQKTPRREIETALERAKEVENDEGE
jgi:phage-related protein